MSTTVTGETDCPIDEMETQTVSVYVFADGQVRVVADQDPDHADWLSACDYLASLGFGPCSLGPCEFDRELDTWSLRLPATALASHRRLPGLIPGPGSLAMQEALRAGSGPASGPDTDDTGRCRPPAGCPRDPMN